MHTARHAVNMAGILLKEVHRQGSKEGTHDLSSRYARYCLSLSKFASALLKQRYEGVEFLGPMGQGQEGTFSVKVISKNITVTIRRGVGTQTIVVDFESGTVVVNEKAASADFWPTLVSLSNRLAGLILLPTTDVVFTKR
ncbi:MAG: hypothetical protein AB7F28_05670 [Candidatus Margulisiibacteriota bacterium]